MRRALLLCLVLGAAALPAWPATLIDFEDLPPGTTVRGLLASRGVVFPDGGYIDTDPAARSGSRVLRSANPVEEFNQRPLVILFTSGQQRVSLFAGAFYAFPPNPPGVLRAFDAAGNEVAHDGPRPVANRAFTTAFTVTTPGPTIVRLELRIGTADFESIDDLEFEGEEPAPVPSAPPVVRIVAPAEGAELDGAARLAVSGTVTGRGVLPSVVMRWEVAQAPDANVAPWTSSIPLRSDGDGFRFDLEIPGIVSLGPQTIVVEAEAAGGLTGRASVRFSNLPSAIRARAAAAGLASLRWGVDLVRCRIGVYPTGAVSLAGRTTTLIQGEILQKWLALADAGVPGAGRLGCPNGEQRAVAGGAFAQDFERGRIYAQVPGAARWVPTVFAEALDRLGGEVVNGLPVGDPSDAPGVPRTWLFQRFSRPGQPGLPSTFEIRGDPPVLLVERQGGDLATLTAGGVALEDKTATVWQSFSCRGTEGPCEIGAPPAPPRQQSLGTRFCGGTVYPLFSREWPAISGDHNATTIAGFAVRSHRAWGDNPLAHEHYGDPPYFPSDWNVHIQPFTSYQGLLNPRQQTLEIEFEQYFAQYFFVQYDWPVRGDLVTAIGRWIVDCGHPTYNAEIHPPFLLAFQRTEIEGGRPATATYIWVNGYFPGEPITLDLFPPPRPTPDAQLIVTSPRKTDAAVGLDVLDEVLLTGQVRLRFTAPLRRVPITGAGEMKWGTGRDYQGRWVVSWSGS